jgi:hypothetical protein
LRPSSLSRSARPAAKAPAAASAQWSRPPDVAFGGFSLTSTAIDLPIDDQQYPDGRMPT